MKSYVFISNTFYIQNTLYWLTHYLSDAWGSTSHLQQWISAVKHFQIRCSASFNSGIMF